MIEAGQVYYIPHEDHVFVVEQVYYDCAVVRWSDGPGLVTGLVMLPDAPPILIAPWPFAAEFVGSLQ
jgi:hypothetical protein